jgi:Flp pilus assembly protein TadB
VVVGVVVVVVVVHFGVAFKQTVSTRALEILHSTKLLRHDPRQNSVFRPRTVTVFGVTYNLQASLIIEQPKFAILRSIPLIEHCGAAVVVEAEVVLAVVVFAVVVLAVVVFAVVVLAVVVFVVVVLAVVVLAVVVFEDVVFAVVLEVVVLVYGCLLSL